VRLNCDEVLSLVVVDSEEIVGHILFSPATIEGNHRTVSGMALGPMAVPPEHQLQSIGSAPVKHGLASLHQHSCPFVIVVGHL